jgi:nicotinamide-nucleotide amidase
VRNEEWQNAAVRGDFRTRAARFHPSYFLPSNSSLKKLEDFFMNAELIAVGTEILLGDIVNTDAQVISQGLSELGINVYYQTVVGDNPQRLERAIREAKDRADIIITTGGLGPTLDDLTKETLASVFGKKMELHQPSLDRITEFFRKIGREMTPNNEKQAWLPEGCTVFVNEWGTAPGCGFEADGKHVLMLPGPPRECTPMWEHCAKPYLYPLAGGCIVSHSVRVFGLGESAMEDRLHDLMATMTNPTIAPYAKTSECFARVTAMAVTEEEAEKLLAPVVDQVVEMLGADVYGVDVDSLEQVVGDGLRERGMTLAVAESCTGGLLSKRITDLPGASDYYLGGVCSYSNDAKMKLLGVQKETLDQFGAVSAQTAEEMAEGAAKTLGADVGVGITGIAGPGGATEGKEVGLVYISVYFKGELITRKTNNSLGRDRVRNQAASTALDLIRRKLQGVL